jgi:hypothetical protein
VTLSELEVIRVALERKAGAMLSAMPGAAPDTLAGMVPAVPGADEENIRSLERELGHELSPVFRDVLSTYEIAGLELAGVVFGGETSFCDFLRHQISAPRSVWGAWERPQGLLVVASSTGYVVFVSSTDGHVSACLRDNPIESRAVVATDFTRFVKALGTLVLIEAVEDEASLAVDIAREVGAPESVGFWLDRIRGYA